MQHRNVKPVEHSPDSTARSSLKKQALGGLGWSFGSTGASFAVQLGHAAIMARLLVPTDFGILALANAFLRFGGFLSQIGVGHALIQASTLSSAAIRTAHTMTVIFAAAFTLAFVIAAPLAGYLTASDMVVPVTQVLAINLLVTGFGVTSMSLLRRAMRFRALAILDIGSYVTGYVFIGITLAANGAGVWSLVAAVLCQATLQTAGALLLVRHSLIPQLDRVELQRLYGFGARFSLVQVITVIRHTLTNALVGRLAGIDMLGVFDRAKLLVTLPFEKIEANVTKVLFPVMSRAQGDKQLLRQTFTLHAALVAAFAIPAMVGLTLHADVVVLVLLGDQWTHAATLLPFITIGAVFGLLSHFARVLADALALLNSRIRLEMIHLVTLAVALTFGARGGIVGMTAAVAFAQALQFVLYQRLMAMQLGMRVSDYLRSVLPGLLGSVVVGAVLYVSRLVFSMSSLNPFVTLILQVGVGLSVLALVLRTPLFASLRSRLVELAMPSTGAGVSRMEAVMGFVVWLSFGDRPRGTTTTSPGSGE